MYTSGDGTTEKDIPQLLQKCFGALVEALFDDNVRNSVTVELNSQQIISDEIKCEATRVAGDPQHKALVVVHELFLISEKSKQKLLTIAKVLKMIPEVNKIGVWMETLFWRIVTSHILSGIVHTSTHAHILCIRCLLIFIVYAGKPGSDHELKEMGIKNEFTLTIFRRAPDWIPEEKKPEIMYVICLKLYRSGLALSPGSLIFSAFHEERGGGAGKRSHMRRVIID